MRARQRILRLVLSGRIGEAVSSVNDEYPGLMDRNPDLLFRYLLTVHILPPPSIIIELSTVHSLTALSIQTQSAAIHRDG